MELLELGRGGVVKVVCFRQHITLVLAPSSPGDAPAAAGVELAPAAAAAAPMKEVAAAAGSGAGRRRRGQRHRRRRREARAALLLQRLARGWVARLRVRGLRGSREEQVFGSLGSEPEQPAHAVERPTVLVLATSTAWEARRQEVAASAVEVEAPAAGLLPKDRPKLSPEKRKVGPAEPASPSKRASVAVVPTCGPVLSWCSTTTGRRQARSRWPPGGGWRGGMWLGCVLLCHSCPRLSRAAMVHLPRRRRSGGWTSAPRCPHPSVLGWRRVSGQAGCARWRGLRRLRRWRRLLLPQWRW